MDEMECGNLFDQIDDLIEFPPDNGESGDGKLVGSSCGKDFPTWDEALQDCDPLFSCSSAAELSVPHEDIVQMEWLSTFMEDSFSGRGLTLTEESLQDSSTHNQFQTSSPVSLVESSSSSSTSSSKGKTQRARSKRPRPPTFNPRPPIHLISPSASAHLSESDSFADSESLPLKKKKTKKIKISPPAANQDHPVRKCLHCEITKTPQWRAGPMGPKTLCNACGVRFKSGRLFPEYRPAASPTFVPALHSNSHKKVVEMRSKFQPTQTAAESGLVPKVNASL